MTRHFLRRVPFTTIVVLGVGVGVGAGVGAGAAQAHIEPMTSTPPR